jgi:drug/metabolite transporter (DMT)-like permease
MASNINKPKLFVEVALTMALCWSLNWGLSYVALATEDKYGHFVMFIAMASFMVLAVLLYAILFYINYLIFLRRENRQQRSD